MESEFEAAFVVGKDGDVGVELDQRSGHRFAGDAVDDGAADRRGDLLCRRVTRA